MLTYQENTSFLAGNQSDKLSSGHPAKLFAQQSAKNLADVSAKIYANQLILTTVGGWDSGDNLKSGKFTPFAKGDFSHLMQGLFGITTRGRIEFLQSIKKEHEEFSESIKKGSQSATLGNVDIKYRASENINTSLLLWYGKYQFLGSMPRDCNSFRITLLIHAARDSSPSCACATSIISRSSGSSLNWNGGFPRLSVLCVDTSITPVVWYLCVITHYTLATQKTMPRSGGTLTGHLTTNDNTSIEVAMPDHNTPVTGRTSLTPNQSYRWLFLALNRSDYTAKPCRIAVTAPNENSARLMLVRDYMLIFAGRLPAQEVAHA
ncbi:Uncharacterised protein [Providencia heimbachae]|uniref:Phage immunity repressor protein n=2 Tax=Providencia heimbachae TaxID=333962 RepID=A0A1B7K0I8_9GAMM|nr:hypothetical protein M998_0911 [Providencia heimbachae ATCC 35613]SQH13961.1 Uncharacterised protein [Providencia heimbachae]